MQHFLDASPRAPRRRLVVLALAGVLAAAALVAPSPAAAGEFTITACQADAGEFASGAFENLATRGMRWRRACNPLGPGLRGLVTANVVTTGHVAHGAQSAFVLNAPPGTVISRFRWSGHASGATAATRCRCTRCGPTARTPRSRTCGPTKAVPDPTGRRRRAGRGREHSTSAGRPRSSSESSASARSSAQFCSGRGLNYMQTFTAEATVVDNSGPSVSDRRRHAARSRRMGPRQAGSQLRSLRQRWGQERVRRT